MNLDARAYRTFQALILGGLGIYLLSLVGDGRILLYINQRFTPLAAGAAIGFLFLAQAVLKARPAAPGRESSASVEGNEYSSTALWLLALPLLVGLLVPQRALGATAASLRGVRAGLELNLDAGKAALAVPPRERNVMEWMQALAAAPDPASLHGEPVDITGFVVRTPGMSENRLVVTRFSVTCCVADAAAIGLETVWDGANLPPENSWVRVRGILRVSDADGRRVGLVLAEALDRVPAPEQPYLFP